VIDEIVKILSKPIWHDGRAEEPTIEFQFHKGSIRTMESQREARITSFGS